MLSAVVLSTLTVMSLAFLQVSTQSDREHQSVLDDVHAFYVAEAGLTEAAISLSVNADGDIGSMDAPVRYGDGLFWVDATDNGDETWNLRVTSLCGEGRVSLDVVVETQPDPVMLGQAIWTDERMTIKNSMLIDSFDAADGSYASQAKNSKDGVDFIGTKGNLRSNSHVALDPGSNVFGDAWLGPMATFDNKGNFHGVHLNSTRTTNLAPVDPPVLAVPKQGKKRIKGSNGKSGKYDLALAAGEHHFEDLQIGFGASVRITGPATILVEKAFQLDNSTLEIDGTDGPVIFYVKEDAEFDHDAKVITTSGQAKDFFLMIGQKSDYEMKAKLNRMRVTKSEITGVIYTPYSHLTVKDSNVYGTLMAYSMHCGESSVHFDESLTDVSRPEIGEWGVSVLSWQVAEVDEELRANRADPFKLLGVHKENLLYAKDTWDASLRDQDKAYTDETVWDADSFPWLTESEVYDWTIGETTTTTDPVKTTGNTK